MENIELDVGGTKIRGVWIAIVLSFASTIGGGIWTASEFFNRLQAQEEAVQEALGLKVEFSNTKETIDSRINTFDTKIQTVEQRLQDNDVAGLQGKLATLGANLESIMKRQNELLDLRDKVSTLETKVVESGIKTESQLDSLKKYDEDMKRIKREIEDLWNGMDALSNPLN
jgi:DNA repair ATPase RecN